MPIQPQLPPDKLFTGFLIFYKDGTFIHEKNFHKNDEGVIEATNWKHIDKEEISLIEMWWHGEKKWTLCLNGVDRDSLNYSHTGSWSIGSSPCIISRNVSYTINGITRRGILMEKSGDFHVEDNLLIHTGLL